MKNTLETEAFELFHYIDNVGYDEPLRSWQFSVSFPNLGSVWVSNVGFKLFPSISIEYLGNPHFGKPRRMLRYDSSQLGDMTIECLDEATNKNLKALLGQANSSAIADGSKNVFQVNVVQYLQTMDKSTGSGNLVPYILFKTACSLIDFNFSDTSSDDNSFSTLHTVLKIDGVEVHSFNTEDGFNSI